MTLRVRPRTVETSATTIERDGTREHVVRRLNSARPCLWSRSPTHLSYQMRGLSHPSPCRPLAECHRHVSLCESRTALGGRSHERVPAHSKRGPGRAQEEPPNLRDSERRSSCLPERRWTLDGETAQSEARPGTRVECKPRSQSTTKRVDLSDGGAAFRLGISAFRGRVHPGRKSAGTEVRRCKLVSGATMQGAGRQATRAGAV